MPINRKPSELDIANKATLVIDSCKTEKQMLIAVNYLFVASRQLTPRTTMNLCKFAEFKFGTLKLNMPSDCTARDTLQSA